MRIIPEATSLFHVRIPFCAFHFPSPLSVIEMACVVYAIRNTQCRFLHSAFRIPHSAFRFLLSVLPQRLPTIAYYRYSYLLPLYISAISAHGILLSNKDFIMTAPTSYLDIEMATETATALARQAVTGRDPRAGLWLYAIVRAIHYPQLLAKSSDAAVLLWLAVAAQGNKVPLEVVTAEDAVAPTHHMLSEAGFPDIMVQPAIRPPLRWTADQPSIRYIEDTAAESHLFVPPSADTHGQDLVIAPADAPRLVFEPPVETVVIGGAWRLYGGRKIRYAVSESDKAVAILLAALQPKTLALGMNVIFDGTLKPRGSKINFSGTGGQIGEGDVLICHPDNLNHYSPLPGAVALVLGRVTDPVQAFTCELPLGNEVLTLVIK
jgi:hypothetical protein